MAIIKMEIMVWSKLKFKLSHLNHNACTHLQPGEALEWRLDDLWRGGGPPDEERGLLALAAVAEAARPGRAGLVGQPARRDGLRVVVVLAVALNYEL